MPIHGPTFGAREDVLDPAQIEAVVRAAVGVGFRKFRLTGGEPTLRPDLLEIVARVACVPGVRDLAMTTNAVLLPRLATSLVAAGLRRVNIHLDSLDRSGSRGSCAGERSRRSGRGSRRPRPPASTRSRSTRS
jgi:cyclic pyranopterin phosphate synthase